MDDFGRCERACASSASSGQIFFCIGSASEKLLYVGRDRLGNLLCGFCGPEICVSGCVLIKITGSLRARWIVSKMSDLIEEINQI